MPVKPDEELEDFEDDEEGEEMMSELDLEIASLDEQAQEQFPPDLYEAITKIAPQISRNGLSLEEACLLANYNYKKMKQLMKTTPLISRIIQMKELTFKRDLLATLAKKARSGDDKMAQWFLERKYPQEFGRRSTASGDDGGGDLLFEAIKFIQKSGDSSPLVKESSATALRITKDGGRKLSDFLN